MEAFRCVCARRRRRRRSSATMSVCVNYLVPDEFQRSKRTSDVAGKMSAEPGEECRYI